MDSLRPEIRMPSDPKGLTDADNDIRRSGVRSLVTVRRALWLDITVSSVAGALTMSLYAHLAPIVARGLDLNLSLAFDIPAVLFLTGFTFGLTLFLLRRHSTRH
jgi:hypothetical protein